MRTIPSAFPLLEIDVDAEIRRQVESGWEKALFRRILDITNGNQLEASELLGITRTTVRRKMDVYGL